MLGSRYGYYTTNEAQAYEIDSMVEFAYEITHNMLEFTVGKGEGQFEDEDAGKRFISMWAELSNGINRRLGRTRKKYAAGTDTITIADFACGAPYYMFINN